MWNIHLSSGISIACTCLPASLSASARGKEKLPAIFCRHHFHITEDLAPLCAYLLLCCTKKATCLYIMIMAKKAGGGNNEEEGDINSEEKRREENRMSRHSSSQWQWQGNGVRGRWSAEIRDAGGAGTRIRGNRGNVARRDDGGRTDRNRIQTG